MAQQFTLTSQDGQPITIRVLDGLDVAGHQAAAQLATPEQPHDCNDYAIPYASDGALGHGWECGLCGAFLQAG